jgi:DNA-binding NarL/FixJ family response regulator
MSRITVLLVDDHTVVREGFRKMLEFDKDLNIIGEAKDGREAVTLVEQLRPDVVLMDIAMPRLNGLAATKQMLKVRPETKVLILSAHGDESYVKNAAEAGAVGFMLKQTTMEEVGRAIRAVNQGKPFFSVQLPGSPPDSSTRSSARLKIPDAKSLKLTSREMEILQLVAEGSGNKEIALELGIGIKTVEKHREHLMVKLGLHDTAGLTRYAIRAGIIESSVQVTTT